MKTFLQIILILMAEVAITSAQSPSQNLNKYWFYRDRLTKCFVFVGDGPGESLVASQRGPSDDLGSPNVALDYGEDQTIYLGWYIATLATEYALEEAHNLDKEQTKKELYFALQAFNRIDYDAEWYYRGSIAGDDDNNGYSDDLNGFFTRNDLGYSYYDPNPFDPAHPQYTQFIANHSMQYLSIPGYSLLNLVDDWGVRSWHLNFSNYQIQNPPIMTPNDYQGLSNDFKYSFEMSKDQVNAILLGLAFVKKCVDDDGNIGISDDYPSEKLTINGNIYAKQSIIGKRSTTGSLAIAANTGSTDGGTLELYSATDNKEVRVIGNAIRFYDYDATTASWNQNMNINSDGKVGIGTEWPSAKLHIVTAENSATVAAFQINNSDQTNLFTVKENGQVGINWDFSDASHAVADYKLAVNGKIISTGSRVQLQTAWPDYVFDTTHSLMSLTELEVYVYENKHLPLLPPANEVANQGIDLGEMNRLLVEKVEELTLYIIDMQKQIDQIKNY